MGAVIQAENNTYRVVLIKTIENEEIIYYRCVNLVTYQPIDIPAYRIFDAIVQGKIDIINTEIRHNKICIVNDDGYESVDDIIIIDEFDNEVPNLYEFCLHRGDKGAKIISRYSQNNIYSLSNYKIDSTYKLEWECEEGHKLRLSFATYYGIGCKCPICEAKKLNKALSFYLWCQITGNIGLLKSYDDAAELNNKDSKRIAWNSKKRVYFRVKDEICEGRLDRVIGGLDELPFGVINLTKY